MKFSDYTAHGWKLCGIPRGTKGPLNTGWQRNPIPADAVDGLDGAGLMHSLSGTCAIDLDDLSLAKPWLADRDIDVDSLLNADDAVRIDSGRPGRAKLIYRMTRPLRTLQPEGSGLELRCMSGKGTTVQDVLPPTIHPDTQKPYRWVTGILGDWRKPPAIPPKLLTLWQSMAEPIEEPQSAKKPAKKPVNLEKLRKAVYQHKPNCEYPEWFKVGGQIHDATGGDIAGLQLWCEWSKGITRKPYPGDQFLKDKWRTMGTSANPATGEALLAGIPADRDDFEDMPSDDAPAQPAIGKSAERAAAREALFTRYVYIMLEEDYFDVERNARVGDKTIRHKETPYMPYKNGRLMDPIVELMNSPKKAFVEAQAFHPGEKTIFEHQGRKFANSFLAASLPMPLEPTADELEKIEWLFARLNDEEFREWLRQFYAHMVQYPAKKIRTAPLIWSKRQGNGKTTMAHLIPQLLAGDRYYQEVDYANLESNFNDYLIGKWVASLTEFRAGTRGERALIAKKCERWVADDMLSLGIKNGRGCTVPNYLVITASSNEQDAVAIDKDNRKWTVFNMSEVPKMTKQEKGWIFEGFLRGPRARAVLRHYFLNVPITTFNPNEDALVTKDRQEMIEASNPMDLELLITRWEERTEPMARDVVITSDVGDYVRKHCIAKPANDRIGKLLCGPPFNGVSIKFRAGIGQYRAVVLRGHWASASGKDIMAHINGDDVSLDAKDELLL